MDPTKPRILYAGTQDLGLFKTTDGAETWVRINTGLSPVQPNPALTPFTALAVDPKTPTTLYAAAGQGMVGSVGGRLESVGRLYKSTDGGVKWALSSAGLSDPKILSIVIAPQVPRIIFATTTENGVMKSSDAGASWQPTGVGLTSSNVSVLAIDPRSPDTLYVGTGDRGVFKSIDGGASWSVADRGMTNKAVQTLAIDPRMSSTIYALTAAGNVAAVFRSVDAGENWQPLSRMPRAFAPAFAIDAGAPSTLYLAHADGQVFKSVDAGATWGRASAGLSMLVAFAVTVDPAHSGVVYAGVRAGGQQAFFKSTNGGATWARSDSGLNDSVIKLVADPRSSATLYAAGTQGLFKSTDGGASWKRSDSGLPAHDSVGAVGIDPWDSSKIYAGTLNGGVFKSTDGGRTWRPSSSGLDSRSVYAIAVDPHSAAVYAVLADLMPGAEWVGGPRKRERIGGVFRSADGGATWSGSDAGLPLNVKRLVIDPKAPRLLHASTGGGVFTSRDAGVTWTRNNSGLDSAEVLGLSVSPQSAVFAQTRSGVFRQLPGQGDWKQINVGFPDQPVLDVLALAIDPRDSNVVYAGTATHGVFKSTNGGASWRASNAGLAPSPAVASPPDPPIPQSLPMKISALDDAARSVVESLAEGERSHITIHPDCNTCRCDVQRISPTEYVTAGCGCTRMRC